MDENTTLQITLLLSCALQPLHRLGSNDAARKFFETRNHLANFFTTNEGAVTGQDKYVTRGAKRIKIY
jgi:hypothetical protein